MQLRSGVPHLAELAALERHALYRQHCQCNEQFLAAHADALSAYGKRWGRDPFRLWSRRWEYPYAAQRLLEFLARAPSRANGDVHLLDAGSGVTYFPHYILSRERRTRVWCADADSSYASALASINAASPQPPRLHFLATALQRLPLDDGQMDAIACISVLEHTEHHRQIVDELHRVLRPGGLLVLTFDVSLDGKFALTRRAALALLRHLAARFALEADCEPAALLSQLDQPGILTTDHVRAHAPTLLPWSWPVRVVNALRDLIGGRGWTGGFRSRTVCCLQARKPEERRWPESTA
jgi:SAM-dependent methyltransferase